MRADGIAAALIAPLVACGCYCSHEIAPRVDAAVGDAPSSIDAPTSIDAPPDAGRDAGASGDRYWVLVPASPEVSLERCQIREGQLPIVRVRIEAPACDEPGNAWLEADHAARVLRVRAFTWRPRNVPPCPPATIVIERDATLDRRLLVGLAAGPWTLEAPDGSRIPFVVQEGPPELTCTDCIAPGETCEIDQECIGDRSCVARRGDAICDARCQTPCQPFPDAPEASDLSCTIALGVSATCVEDGDYGWICAPAARDLCPACPDGQRCIADADALSYCEWEVSEWAGGGRCAGDGDCSPGYSCIEGAGGRTCGLRCRGDHACPYERCAPGLEICGQPKI